MACTFKIPIGDWSNDGHAQCHWYIVESNKPVEEVREVHFRGCKEVFDIHSVCNEYEEYQADLEDLPEWVREFFDHEGHPMNGSGGMAELWLEMLRRTDPDLVLKLVPEDISMLPFYGHDDQKRHIGTVGYGLFDRG